MNKLLLMGLVIASSVSLVYSAETNKLHKAIEASDPEAAASALRRLVPLTTKAKAELLTIAQDVLDEREGGVSLLKSRVDLSKVVFGSLVAIATLGKSTNLSYKKIPEIIAGIGLVGVGAYGIYIALKGYWCSTAHDRIVSAEQVIKAIEGVRVKDEETKDEVLADETQKAAKSIK